MGDMRRGWIWLVFGVLDKVSLGFVVKYGLLFELSVGFIFLELRVWICFLLIDFF